MPKYSSFSSVVKDDHVPCLGSIFALTEVMNVVLLSAYGFNPSIIPFATFSINISLLIGLFFYQYTSIIGGKALQKLGHNFYMT